MATCKDAPIHESPPARGSRTQPRPTHVAQISALVAQARRYPGGVTRSDLMEMLDLGRNAIDRRLAVADGLGLLTHAGQAESTGGRPAEEWRFNDDAASVLALRISYRASTCTLTNLAGRALAHEDIPVGMLDGPDAVLTSAFAALGDLRDDAPQPVWGIAASVPLPVDFRYGSIVDPLTHDPEIRSWPGLPLRSLLAEELAVPAWVDDEVNAMSLAAATRIGAPKDLLYIRFSIGLGLGLVADHRVNRGAGGGSGEIAHVQVAAANGITCRCGRTGCLETIVSGAALERGAQQPQALAASPYLRDLSRKQGRVTVEEVFSGVARGDRVCTRLVTEMAERLSAVIAVLTTTYNPGEIVLGGDVVNAGDRFTSIFDRALRRRIPVRASSRLRVRMGGEDDAVVGLARLATERILSPRNLLAWIAPGSPIGVKELLTAHRQDM